MLYSDAVFCTASGAPRGFVQPHKLSGMPSDTPLLVGLSGGADSTLLLHLAVRWAADAGARVYAAHLHHGIRGTEADRDEAFCRETAARLGVPLFVGRADVPAAAALSGDSLETAARKVRYAFFASIMTGCAGDGVSVTYIPAGDEPRPAALPLLLTAHHADDQLETVLLRLFRGAGVKGLGGIPPVREVPGGRVIRPLLRCTRADVLAACARLGLTFVTDSTNLTGDASRTALRREILPALRTLYGEGVPEAAAVRLSDAAREDNDCLESIAGAWYASHGADGLLPDGLSGLHPAILNRVLLLAYRDAVRRSLPENVDGLPADRTLTAAHLTALRTLVREAAPHSGADLPRGLRAVIGDAPERRLTFCLSDKAKAVPCTAIGLRLGDNPWGSLVIRLETAEQPPAGGREGKELLAEGYFPLSVLDGPLTARPREAGDLILCHGMHKSLKKLYCDRHVPVALRARLPLICTENGVLWAPLAAFADGYPAPVSGPALHITLRDADRP